MLPPNKIKKAEPMKFRFGKYETMSVKLTE